MGDAPVPYRVEPAKSGRSYCKISKELIEKGELRFGSLVEMGGHASYHWRKLSSLTPKVIKNVEAKVGDVCKLDGYADLSAKQQSQVQKAFKQAVGKGVALDKAKEKDAKVKATAKLKKEKAKEAKAKTKAKALDAKAKAKAKTLAAKSKAKGKPKAKPAQGPAASGAGPLAKKQRAEVASGDGRSSEPDAKSIKAAHQAIDLAKEAKWKDLFALLKRSTAGVVNVRPEVRDFGVLHQAAFHGSLVAVNQLIDQFGADAGLLSKKGLSAAEVARRHGFEPLARSIEVREASLS